MIGIFRSNNPWPRAAALAAALAALSPANLTADRVALGGEHQLSGRVTGIDGDGRVTIVTGLAPEPLVIRPDAVAGVTLAPAGEPAPASPDQEIHLVNGDVIPCRIEALDEHQLRAQTWFAGSLEVPREHLAAIHFGVLDPTLLLDRNEALRGWSQSDAWNADEETGTLASSGTGKINRRLAGELPELYIIRFRYEWKGNPNLRFYFADNLPEEGAGDRYILTINTAGMELKRQSTRGRTNHTLAQDPRRPGELSPNGLDLELRVDRTQREPLLHLLVNGDLVGRFIDPVEQPPSASGLMLESGASGNSSNIVSRLEVLEWGGESATRPQRGDDDPDQDIVCDRQGERFSGTAERITATAIGAAIIFRHPHAAEPLHVPLDQAASLWFRRPPHAHPAAPQPALTLRLVRGGSFQLDSCRIDERSATCTHPLLGPLVIDRRAIESLDRRPGPPKP
jgi:hypothetical protein